MNRKLDTAFGGRDGDCMKAVKKIRVNGDDVIFDFGKSTSDLLDQECGGFDIKNQERKMTRFNGDRMIVTDTGVTDSDLLDQECGGFDTKNQEGEITRVNGVVDGARVIVTGVDGITGSCDDDGGTHDGDNHQDDGVLMGNSGNNSTLRGGTFDEEQVVGPNEQVTTSSSFNFSQAFVIGFHVFTNKLLNLIAGNLSPSEVLAIVHMLQTLLPLVVILYTRIFQVTSGWIFGANVVEEDIESFELASEPNHVKFAFLLNGVTDINHANFFIQDNQRLVVKGVKVISGRLVPIGTSVNLPLGNFALATTEKTFDKVSGLLTISITNFI